MKKKHALRTPFIAVLGLLAFLVVPSAAQAHHMDATASCVLVGNQPTVQLKVTFVDFSSADSRQTISGSVSLVGVAGSGTTFASPPPGLSWDAGNDASFTTSWTATGGQAYTANANFTWTANGKPDGDNKNSTTGVCPTGTPPDNPPGTPPRDTPPGTTPPGTTPPGTTPETPGGGVLPETVASGLARLQGPSGCVKQAFTARVSGRSIASVAFYVDGKLLKRFNSAKSAYSVKVNPNRLGFGRHRVIARVKFAANTGTRIRRLPLTFRRCAQGAVAPRFTG